MKRILSILLVLAMVCCMLPIAAFAEEITASGICGDNLTWTLDGEGVLTISGTGDMENYSMMTGIPWGYNILEVVIEDGVTGIGEYAFATCFDLVRVTIPDSVASIGSYAFADCDSLTEVVIGDGVTSIGNAGFGYCDGLVSVTIPDGVASIGDYAFYECTSLESATIPGSVASLGTHIFEFCYGLKSATICDGVQEIPDCMFQACTSLTKLSLPDGIKRIGSNAFSYCPINLESLPKKLETIGNGAFSSSGLTAFVIYENVRTIGASAFALCEDLSMMQFMGNAPMFEEKAETLPVFTNVAATIWYPKGNATWTEDVLQDYGGTLTWEAVEVLTQGSLGDNLKWKLSDDGTLTISGTGAMPDYDAYNYAAAPWYGYAEQVKRVVIQQGITTIGAQAFYGCANMTEVSIADTVTSIGAESFFECTSLTAVELPGNAAQIHDHAFVDCCALEKVELPEGLTAIGAFAFSGCVSLTDVTIPGSVASIGTHAFYYCLSLEKMVIPASVTYIGACALTMGPDMGEITVIFEGDPLTESTDVFELAKVIAYYPADNENWDPDNLPWYGNYVKWTAYTPGSSDDPRQDIPAEILTIDDGTFAYHSEVTKEMESYSFTYDENWFVRDSTAYNHDLAQMSIRMAMASAWTTSENIQNLFDDLGFYYINDVDETIECSVTDEVDSIVYPEPTEDSIGYAIGSKKIKDENGEVITLIAVAVRGGGYKKEWVSNFVIGTGDEHQGFSEAAATVTHAVEAYIEAIGAEENIKIWLTGYSRAAATANIAAHNLSASAKNGSIDGLEVEGIYAYCFECPRGTRVGTSDSAGISDRNIFNIVNAVDVVPMVAPASWYYGRYGTTFYLPSGETTYDGYLSGYAKMLESYRSILNGTGAIASVLDLTSTVPMQSSILNGVIDGITAVVGSPETYTEVLQETVCEAMAKANSGSETAGAGDVLMSVLSSWVLSTNPVINPLATTVSLATGEITTAHYPELCLAWLDAISGETEYCSGMTRYLSVNCPVDISVYDSAGVLVAQIVNDEVQEIEGSTIGARVDENGQKIVCLPFDEAFEIAVTATDDGTMSYQIQEYSLDSGEATRIINYYDVEIAAGNELIGTAGTAAEEETARYALTIGDAVLEPDCELTGDAAEKVLVSVSCEDDGTVTGGGYFVPGEFARITAEPEEGKAFLGWYINGEPVSEDSEYRLRVESGVEIIGRFGDLAIPGDLNCDGVVNDGDVAQLLWYTLFPEAYEIKGNADFNGDGSIDDADVAYLLWHTLFPENYPL